MIEKYQNSKFIFVVGIGGSDLASKAVWNAMTSHKPETDKKLFFLESPELREYEEIKKS
jgi:glucose-6-phosphate isomerase